MSPIDVFILGSGGREHALAAAVYRSPMLGSLHIAPGNGGTRSLGAHPELDVTVFSEVANYLAQHSIDVLIIGPEQPLTEGLRDYLESRDDLTHLLIIGPGRAGARLEGSKVWSKAFMARHDIPTAQYHEVTERSEGVTALDHMNSPYVLKADGLAAGKGVLIHTEYSEAVESIEAMLGGQFGAASERIIIEEFLNGREFSVFILTDGNKYISLPVARDYKRVGEGDTGLNTGGMGSVSPVPWVDIKMWDKVTQRIIDPTVKGLREEGIPYCGFIFFGLIDVDGDPYVIEYNARMGDPETQVVLERLDEDFLALLLECAEGIKESRAAAHHEEHVVNVILASGGYPEAYTKGYPIALSDPASDQKYYHAGTRAVDDALLTHGGRVLSCVARGDTLQRAMERAHALAADTEFKDKYYRLDIARDMI